ncbi:helix-turn-helix domain-containing protein [Rhodococcus sp. 008]|uniref:helix-turn-helix domain-containing protein n=1 Tax=Rhodococcus sp. 008 TaxID=1723645 RepID=UPI001E4BB840|nr:GAF domain-containing protein [Rhodococcus sp. 008]
MKFDEDCFSSEVALGSGATSAATSAMRVATQLVRAISRTGVGRGEASPAVLESLTSIFGPISVDYKDFRESMADLIREVASQHEARDDQYRALLDTVADITSEDDPNRLLGGIAERARRLLRADVVYLWLAEEDGDYARLGATSGGMTSELLNLRVPARMAMTGRIIDTGMPLIVSEYFGDQNFVHYPEIDRVMEREKIVATVGVPLVNGSTRLGALIAANRDERTYSPADLDLLHSLAGHAAISIERSRLSEQTKSALHSLEAANRELARRNTESERTTAAHFTLSQVALAGGNIDNLVHEVAKIVEGQLAVFDPDGRLLADAGNFSGAVQPPDSVREASLTRTTFTADNHVAVPILAATRLLGTLYYQPEVTPAKPVIQILERAAVVAALLLLLAEAEAGAAGFRRDDFIDDLLSGDEPASRLIHRAAQMRVELRQSYTIHVVRAPLHERRLAYLADEAAKSRGGLAGQSHLLQRGKKPLVIALMPGLDPRGNSHELAGAIARAGRITPSVAGAGPTHEVIGIRELFDEAVTCSEAMAQIYDDATSGTLADLGFIGLVLSGKPNVDRFVGKMLGPVIRYDAAHHTQLLSTLETILATDGSPTAASETLHVHVSTVKQRMQRLRGVLGEDWRTVERASELRLALKLLRLKEVSF